MSQPPTRLRDFSCVYVFILSETFLHRYIFSRAESYILVVFATLCRPSMAPASPHPHEMSSDELVFRYYEPIYHAMGGDPSSQTKLTTEYARVRYE